MCMFIDKIPSLFDSTRTDGFYFMYDIVYTTTGRDELELPRIFVSYRTLTYVLGSMSKSYNPIVSDSYWLYRNHTNSSEPLSDMSCGYDTPAEGHGTSHRFRLTGPVISRSNMIPTLTEIQQGSSNALAIALEILFEHSLILINTLEPQLRIILKSSPLLDSYTQLIDCALAQIMRWDLSAQSQFISGHPRIGENKNLSKLSAKEQGSGLIPTSPEVLDRLSHLNACYEIRYPGLRYITFVNGRTRLAIAEEMEDMLCFPHSLSPDDPPFDTIFPIDISSEEWKSELDRAVLDIGRIAKSRLGALGLN